MILHIFLSLNLRPKPTVNISNKYCMCPKPDMSSASVPWSSIVVQKLLKHISEPHLTGWHVPSLLWTHTLGESEVSYLIFPYFSLELEVVLVCHLEDRPKAPISALWSKDWGSLLPADAPPYWISVIDWTLQLIGLIWYITISLEFHIGVNT